MFKSLTLAALALVGASACAEYTRLAECIGQSQNRRDVRAVLFVDRAADTSGMVMITIANQGDYLSPTKVDWRSNANGYPRFYDNDFDLDLVVRQSGVSSDDALVGETYIPSLDCEYAPAN